MHTELSFTGKMATSFKKTQQVNPLTFGELDTEDTRYWDNLAVPVTKKEYGNITHVEFSPVAPHNFAVTSSSRVQIYSSRSNELVRSLNRFTQAAACGSYRSDGKLLVAGSDDTKLRLFDPFTRSLLRVFNGHTQAVTVSKFLSDNQRILSASKDKTVRVWDIATEKEVTIYKEFKDYIKCGVTSVASADIFLAGAYDHTAKLFDARTNSSVLSVDHGCPIEDVLMFPTDGVFLTAGGNVVKVWDALSGGRQLTQLCHHHKTVMSLAFCRRKQCVMSASSDRHIKIYDVTNYNVVHTLTYPANILSVAVAPDDSVVVVGMEGGLLSVQHRNKDASKVKTKKSKSPYFKHTSNFKPQGDDIVVTTKKKETEKRFDKMLKRFEHSKALDAALEPHLRQYSEVTMGVILELQRRGALRAAMAGRDVRKLQPLISFLMKNVWKPNFTPLLDVLAILMDLYGDKVNSTPDLQASLRKVKEVLTTEQQYQMELASVKGMLDTFFHAQSS